VGGAFEVVTFEEAEDATGADLHVGIARGGRTGCLRGSGGGSPCFRLVGLL
jgi:hypothetical protein